MISPAVIEKIKTRSSDENGRHCQYYQLDENTGLKAFIDDEDSLEGGETRRNAAYEAQKHCEQFGLAPTTGSKVDLELIDKDGEAYTVYCYTTQHLKMLPENQGMWDCCREINEKYKVHGIRTIDCCRFNCGILPSGEMVMIDFGDIDFNCWD